MDSIVPADLLKLQARLEVWRSTRRYARQPIPEEFREECERVRLKFRT
jgi:hypothetical protein